VRVVISGASGLLGSALRSALEADGHEVASLVRSAVLREKQRDAIHWSPSGGEIDAAGLEGADAVVHLAGESVFGRWTEGKKERIHHSRADGTELLAGAIAKLERKPRVLLSGSAVGYYGDRGDEVLDETSAKGDGFLAGVVEDWERAARPAADAGVRVASLRTGIVLSERGGALAQMLTPFRLGVGGRVGSGRQWMSWIAIDDWVAAVRHLVDTDVAGPVNITSPNPVTNQSFTQSLARVLHRPAVIPVPAFALKAAFGADAAAEMLLVSQRALPARLEASGFTFAYPTVSAALEAVLA
jgi:hypothetical protein